MKGLLACRCCACGAVKGTHDSNAGWWVAMPRGRGHYALDYCPDCSPGLRVRADEVQENPKALAGSRVIPVLWLRAILMALTSATRGFEPRETMGWVFAEKVAQLISHEKFPRALPCREVGFIPEKEAP